MQPVEIHGHVANGFEPVRAAFAKNFAERDDIGACVCVYRHGEPVVDLWGGVADRATGAPWARDTIVTVFSMTKGVTAIAINLLVQRGLIDPDAPVAHYWPEFAAAGKSAITVGTALSHQAGLPRIDRPLTRAEALSWHPVVDAIAAQKPIWEPGSQHGYHMRTFGWIAGELIRRVTGRTPGAFIREEIAEPLGVDFHVGLEAHHEPRVAPLVTPGADYHAGIAKLPADWLLTSIISGPSGHFHYDDTWNTRELRAVELPSSNGVGNARAVARLYAHLIGSGVGGVRLLDEATMAAATTERTKGPDAVILVDTAFGLGFMLPPALPTPVGPRSFGHGGAGGSASFADPDAGIAFSYAMNKMRFDPKDGRSEALARAVYRSLN
jgi:CubicO group peptidase (beta-lactamase class C family)